MFYHSGPQPPAPMGGGGIGKAFTGVTRAGCSGSRLTEEHLEGEYIGYLFN